MTLDLPASPSVSKDLVWNISPVSEEGCCCLLRPSLCLLMSIVRSLLTTRGWEVTPHCLLFSYLKSNLYTCASVSECHVCGCLWSQKGVLGSQAVVSHPTWVLRTKLKSFGRAASILTTNRLSSPQPVCRPLSHTVTIEVSPWSCCLDLLAPPPPA